jgi:uroporphyrinogen-III decarboxylase
LPASSFCAGSAARNQAIAYIASCPDLLPVGMVIGPFSLATRLMRDPITAVALAGMGTDEQQSPEIQLLLQSLRASEAAVLRSIRAQVKHGARAIVVCEPAACIAFFSPRQLKAGSNTFERFVMGPNHRIRAALEQASCDLIFHDCGELIDSMVANFAQRLHPVILSLGSSRKLWDDARLVPRDVVLYGNLPSKSFYSDAAMPVETVVGLTLELIANMHACGHPHIVGSECDVLFVPEAQQAILAKVDAIMSCTPLQDIPSQHHGTVAVHP